MLKIIFRKNPRLVSRWDGIGPEMSPLSQRMIFYPQTCLQVIFDNFWKIDFSTSKSNFLTSLQLLPKTCFQALKNICQYDEWHQSKLRCKYNDHIRNLTRSIFNIMSIVSFWIIWDRKSFSETRGTFLNRCRTTWTHFEICEKIIFNFFSIVWIIF